MAKLADICVPKIPWQFMQFLPTVRVWCASCANETVWVPWLFVQTVNSDRHSKLFREFRKDMKMHVYKMQTKPRVHQ